jgi:hypothetical protein
MTKIYRDGVVVREIREEDEDKVLKDGEQLGPGGNFMLLDAMPSFTTDDVGTALHRPGAIALNDTERDRREAMLAARDAKLQDAWKNPPPVEPAFTQNDAALPVAVRPGDREALERAYERRDAKLRDAWRAA